jgi:collagenase-like PrtC family protease
MAGKRMKILSPLSKTAEVKPLAGAGADEFYCGIVTEEWEKRFSFIASSNLRHDRVANFSSFDQLEQATKIAQSLKKPVFCTFNAHFYSEKQLPLLLNEIQQAIDAGISKVIASDLSLISLLKEQNTGIDIALSTANPAFNFESLAFFKEQDIQRIVLPRHLTVEEIKGLAPTAKSLGLELEAFVLNALCPYIDGLCTFQHVGKNPDFITAEELACRMPFEVETISSRPEQKQLSAKAKASIWQNTLPDACGLCALPSFQKAGIHSLKIAGRGNSSEKKLSDVKMLKQALSLLSLPKEQFIQEMHSLFFKSFYQTCSHSKCYYSGEGLV